MGTNMAVTFANIFMAVVETEILNLSALKLLVWKRYIDDIFSIWNVHKHQVTLFIEQANKHHQTIKFTDEISYTEITFLDTNVSKGERFANKSKTFQYTHFSSCHPLGVKKGFIKGEALRILRTNSSENGFKTKISHFRASLIQRGCPESLIMATLSDIKFENRKQALLKKCKKDEQILSFVTQHRPEVPNLKQLLTQK